MRICIIAPMVLPVLGVEQRYGGIELVVALACENFVLRGHEVYLLASGDSKTSAELIPVVPTSLGMGKSFEREAETNRMAYEQAVALEPDVIWDNTLTCMHVLTQVGKKKGFNLSTLMHIDMNKLVDTKDIPVVHTIHTPKELHYPQLVEKLAQAGHFFTTISDDQGMAFLHYTRLQSLGTVYNAIKPEFYPMKTNADGSYLLWLGRYAAAKGAHIAIEAAHLLDIPIKLVGKLDEEHEFAYFDSFVKGTTGGSDEIISDISTLTLEKKASLYRNAKYTLMPALWREPFGLVAIESMASGTPVVGPNTGALPEIVARSGILINTDDLHLHDDYKTVPKTHHIFAQRIADAIKTHAPIDPQIPRSRIENVFADITNAIDYERIFEKAIYLKSIA